VDGQLVNNHYWGSSVRFFVELYKNITKLNKENHITELWRIREEAKKKGNQMVRLRAEELWEKAKGIEKKYKHFKEEKIDEKK
jgi:hypothetical protein